MAHFEKYTFMAARQELNHDERKHTEGRKNIAPELTRQNYNLGPEHDAWQFLKDKIAMSKNSGGRVNSRSVVCGSCIITLPQGFSGDEHLFFDTAKKHLDGIFGADNCISAWVHYDEPDAQPHLHYKFTPLKENDKGAVQFNAKALITRNFLRSFHNNLESALAAVFGYPVGIINGATTHGNQTTEQLHRLTEAKQSLCEVQKECDELQRQLAELTRRKGIATAELRSVCDMVETMSRKLEALKREVFTLEGDDFSPMFGGLDDRDR